jgi:hypothetical protein
VRFGLPLMVLTSLSLHVILLLLWLLSPGRLGNVGTGRDGPLPGPVMIISKEISPGHPAAPHPAQPPPPAPSVAATAKAAPKPAPAPTPVVPANPDMVMSGAGGPHLSGGGVVFVLDISGSMYEAYAGATRLALARKFLDRQIAALPDGMPFAITLYGETTHRSGPLVRASNATRDAAQRFLGEDFDCGGGTDLPAGLATAEDLHPAGVVIVTDGDLNIADDKLMSEARRILGHPGPQLAVVAIAPRRGTDAQELLRDLAHQQIGTYQAFDVPGASQSAPENPTGNNH